MSKSKKSMTIPQQQVVENQLVSKTMDQFHDKVQSAFKAGGEPAVTEWAVNTVLTSNQEFLLAVDEVLEGMFGFKSSQIDEFHEYLGRMIATNDFVHKQGQRSLSLETMRAIGEIVRSNSVPEKMHVLEKKLGIVLPQQLDTKFLK